MSDSQRQPDTQLIHGVPRDAVPITPLTSFLKVGIDGMLTSFDLGTEDGQWGAYAARQAETFALRDTFNQVILVENVVIHPVEKMNEKSGELEGFFRTVLVSPTGDMFACGSKGVISSIMAYVGCFGRKPPWKPPVEFVISRHGKPPKEYFLIDAVRPSKR